MGGITAAKRRRWAATTAVTLVAVIGLAACSSNSSSSTTTTSGSSASSIGPVKLAFLWEVQGESSVAINDFQNGATLAVSQINAAGGIGGKPVTDVRVSTSVLNTQAAQAAYLQAVGDNPTMMIGLAVQSQVSALGPEIDRAGIPLITTTDASAATNYAAPGTSQWTWNGKSSVDQMAATAVEYYVKDKGYTKIGVMGTNETFGNSGVAVIEATLAKYGLKPYAVAQYSPTATDLTQQVLAMKGAQAVINWGYPNTVAVQLNQFQQNGIDLPSIGPDSAPIAIDAGLVKGAALNGLSVVESCDPESPAPGTKLAAFNTAYKAKYGTSPSQSAVVAFDDVYEAKAAILKAGSTSPAAINKAMAEITVNGACTTYHADPAHVMSHAAAIVAYNASGTSTTVKTYVLPPIPKAS